MMTPKESVAMAATGKAQLGACTEPHLPGQGGEGRKVREKPVRLIYNL
jgi:hypothetical protein